MEYKQAEKLKNYIEQLQAEAFEEGFKVATEQGQRHGHWEEYSVSLLGNIEVQEARCSVCRRYHTTPYIYYYKHYDYCPNCGAKMDEEVKDE